MSYRAKLTLAICSLVLATGAAVVWLAHRSASASTEALAHSLFREVSNRAAAESRSFVLNAAPLVESLVQLADDGLALGDSDRLASQLLAVLKANQGLSWISYGDEAGNFTGAYRPVEGGVRINQSRIVDGKTRLVERDVLPDGSRKVVREEADSGYDPRTRPFYRKAREEARLVWLPPYLFYNQGVPGVSCAAPVYDADRQLRGVISVDFDLTALSSFIDKLTISNGSDVFLFTADEVLLAHPGYRSLAAASHDEERRLLKLADVDDPLVELVRSNYEAPGSVKADADTFEFHQAKGSKGIDYFVSTTAFQVGNDLTWIVGAVAPKSDFLGAVWHSQALALWIGGAAVVVAGLLAAVMARHVSGQVLSLIGFMQRIGGGDLDARADFRGSREFRDLSTALNHMIADLRDRLRLRHSLDIAMNVQQRLLPRRPPQPRGLDVAGHSTYCDETGGDYYDFLVLDESEPDSVLVALGDVMGHGVAAALVMAGARAVLRDRAQTSGSLAELMCRLNRLLAADLEGTRFMTMYLGVFSSRDGLLRWVSAGHDPAIVYDPASETFEEVEGGELPLGVSDDTEYVEMTYGPLRAGQVVLIGTDGVWEMPNSRGEHFGKARLRDVIKRAASKSAAEMVEDIVASLSDFRGSCRQADDVTFVIIKALHVPAQIDMPTDGTPSLAVR